jgi:hypothetical protein
LPWNKVTEEFELLSNFSEKNCPKKAITKLGDFKNPMGENSTNLVALIS